MTSNNLNLREEYYNDIHDMKPKWWMRWGFLSVFVILAILLLLGFSINYPDMIIAEFRLKTNRPSITLPLGQGSRIENILVKNNDTVEKNTHLLIVKSNSNYDDVMLLKEALENFSFEKDSVLKFFDDFLNSNLQVGDVIEDDWISFSNELLEFYKIEQLDSYQLQIDFLRNEVRRQYQLKKQYEKLISTDNKQKQLLNTKIEIDSMLFSKGVISKMEFNGNKGDYYEKTKELQQNELAIKRVNLDIVRLENSIENYKRNEGEVLLKQKLGIRKSLNKLKSSIISWETYYVLISTIKGQITFLQNIKEDAMYDGNVMIVTPLNKEFYGTLKIPFAGAGKVKNGQRVLLKLYDYPYREYGTLEGIVKNISPVADENHYLAKVIFKKNVISNYGKNIYMKENMNGIAEIITNERSVLGRLFEKVIYAFNR